MPTLILSPDYRVHLDSWSESRGRFERFAVPIPESRRWRQTGEGREDYRKVTSIGGCRCQKPDAGLAEFTAT